MDSILNKYNWDKGAIHDNLYVNIYIPVWEDEMAVLDMINQARVSEGKKAIAYSPEWRAFAQFKR